MPEERIGPLHDFGARLLSEGVPPLDPPPGTNLVFGSDVEWRPFRMPSETWEHVEVFWYRTRPRWLPWKAYLWWKRLTTWTWS